MLGPWKNATRWFFEQSAWRGLRYRGLRIGKNPLDLWIYAELIARVRPTLIVEFGTMCGASGLFFCHQLDLIGDPAAQLISVEQSHRHTPPVHPRATWLKGKVLDPHIEAAVRAAAAASPGPVLISEDSFHEPNHVFAVLEKYSDLVTPGSYFVVEDGVLDHVMGQRDRAPFSAIQRFLETPRGRAYAPDRYCERFGITFHPDGWLCRKPENSSGAS